MVSKKMKKKKGRKKEKIAQVRTKARARVFNAGLLADTKSVCIRKVLRSASSIKDFHGFPWSRSKFCVGS
jgi:hypothetical protein